MTMHMSLQMHKDMSKRMSIHMPNDMSICMPKRVFVHPDQLIGIFNNGEDLPPAARDILERVLGCPSLALISGSLLRAGFRE